MKTETTDADGACARSDLAGVPRLAPGDPVLVLTGAGVSAESGVPTFRGAGGLWRSFRPEDLATPEAFDRDPALVWEWYDWRRGLVAAARPNAAHDAIAGLERAHPGTLLVTQNVDGLHALAGSREAVELHGSLWRTRCMRCGREEDDRRTPLPERPPRCALPCGALLRPAVVWFGEGLDPRKLERAFAAARSARLVIVAGTSGAVEPAASLPFAALAGGATVVEVNPEPTPLTPHATLALTGKAAEVVPPLVAALLGRSREAA